MGAIITALVPILSGLLGGLAVPAVFQALTIAQWATIAAALVTAAQQAPQVYAELSALHPVLAKLISYVEQDAESAAQKIDAFVDGFFHITKTGA